MRTILLSLAFLAVTAASAQKTYQNPVINRSLPDPTVLRVGKLYYLYSTEDIRNTPIYVSRNLVNWSYVGTCFTEETRPKMVPGGGIWAPDINKIGNRYVLYYSKSTWGGEWECGIGVAVSVSPRGPFTDKGKLFISSEIGVQNSIDPFYFEEEDGRKFLFWGSFRGIYGIELSDDGLSIKEGAEKQQIAGTLTEGTCIYKHNGYYYLIGSAGSCCEGIKSTYRMVVARSENLFGPYVNRAGQSAMNNNFVQLLNKSSKFVGVGHCSEVVQDDAGQDWLLYHGYEVADPDGGRKVFLDKIIWNESGWPTIKNRMPSETAEAPLIGEEADVEELPAEAQGYDISPRAVTDSFCIRALQEQAFSWQVVDLHGKVWKNGKAQKAVTVNTRDLPMGLYVVTLNSKQRQTSQKILRK